MGSKYKEPGNNHKVPRKGQQEPNVPQAARTGNKNHGMGMMKNNNQQVPRKEQQEPWNGHDKKIIRKYQGKGNKNHGMGMIKNNNQQVPWKGQQEPWNGHDEK